MASVIIRLIISAVVFYVLGVGSIWFENSGDGGGLFFIAGIVGVALVNILISLSETKGEIIKLRKEIAELKNKPEKPKSDDE